MRKMEKVFQGQAVLPELAGSMGARVALWFSFSGGPWKRFCSCFYVKTICYVIFTAAVFFWPVDNLDTLIKFIYMYVFGASPLTTIPVFRGLPDRDTY